MRAARSKHNSRYRSPTNTAARTLMATWRPDFGVSCYVDFAHTARTNKKLLGGPSVSFMGAL